ncbi:MAG: hypothetical protein ACI4D4_03700 [Lachnospira sp.]
MIGIGVDTSAGTDIDTGADIGADADISAGTVSINSAVTGIIYKKWEGPGYGQKT